MITTEEQTRAPNSKIRTKSKRKPNGVRLIGEMSLHNAIGKGLSSLERSVKSRTFIEKQAGLAANKKLNADQVKAILNSTETQASLAAKFGVSQKQISRIKAGDAWKIARDPLDVFNENFDLVYKVSSRWSYSSALLGDDDRISIASVELWNAALNYDFNGPFRAYAAVRIANALRAAMRDDARARRISNQSVSFDFLSELADDGTLTDDEYQSALTDKSTSAETALSDHDDIQTVRAAVDALPPAQAAVIRRRYLGDELGLLSDIGAEHNVSRERIRQIESEALGKLRKRLVR